jgi:Zn-dependent peptidase ImmA (M78 family)
VAFNGQMLILARESRRMTQKTLAEESATAQSAISKAEAGLVMPNDSSIAAWARTLRYRPEMFSPTVDPPPPPRTLFRKRASLSQGDTKAIKASISLQCLHVEALVRSVELPESDVPLLRIGWDLESATEAAQLIRHSWQLAPGPVPNLVEALEDHGVVVLPMQNRSPAFIGLSVWDRARQLPPIMFYNGDAPGDRVRWTLAHELGHIVLHHHQLGIAEECEEEADEFAGELLMPARDIRHHFSSRTSLEELAQLKLHWRVSMQSLLMRGQSVGRISKTQATRLWKLIGMYGYRKVEPNRLPVESPSLLPEIVRVHVEDLQFSLEDLCALLWLEPEEARALYRPNVDPSGTPPRLRLVE